MNWKYDATAYNPNANRGGYQPIPEGNYRCRISDAVETVTKKAPARPMIVLDLVINGYANNKPLKDYIVLDPADPARTNQRIGELYDCFGLPDTTSLRDIRAAFCNQVGGVHVKHVTYTGTDGKDHTGAKVGWLIPRAEQADLPAWVDVETCAGLTVVEDDADDLPF